jgi:hypothetical protein
LALRGLIIGLWDSFLWQIPQALGIRLLSEEIIILIASLMPLTFSISTVRYHIMDIDFIINRSAVYLIVAIILLGLYA